MDSRSANTGWAVQIATVLGIPIRVHFTFVLLLVWFGYISAQQGDRLPLALAFLILVFGCVLLHELGHALMARRFGVRTRDIVLYPIGGIARLENLPGGRAELMIALAGPAVNLVLAAGLIVLMTLTPLDFEAIAEPQLLTVGTLMARLLLANLILFAFNLIPAFPMDGGRVLRAALSLRMSDDRATAIATSIGQGVAVLFGLVGLLLPNPLLMLIALFVFIGASQENFISRQRAAVQGKAARDAMITRFETLAPQDSLERAARLLIETHQEDFPVVDAWRRVVGVLPRARLLQALARLGGDTAVLEVMDRDVSFAAPDTGLEQVLLMLRTRSWSPVIVLQDDELLGMITLDNLSEFIQISRAGEPQPARAD